MENTPAVPDLPPPLSTADERTWAMLAHLSVLLNLVTGILGPVAALGIYLVYKDRSRYVAYQSLQSLLFQLIGWVGGGAIVGGSWAISGLLAPIGIGCLCMPFALLLTLALLFMPIYGIIGAVQCNAGQDFRYWLVGDWVRSTLTGS
jgi:uncharacterized Tic20 family protein